MFSSIHFNSIKVLVALLVLGFLSSCEKHTEEILSEVNSNELKLENQIAPPSFNGVKVEALTSSTARQEERKFLSFATVEDFEKTMASLSSENIEEWEKYFGFESARKTKDEETLSKEGIEDEYLAAVLSPENIIQIGKWAFRIDILNERVAVVEADSKENVARLFDINYKTQLDENFMLFSTDDNILEALVAGSKGTLNKDNKVEIWGWFCKEDGAPKRKDDGYLDYISSVNRLKSKAVYQKAGVYFSIIMKTKIQWNQFNNGIWVDANPNYHWLESDYNYECEVKCGGSDSGSNPYNANTFVLDRKSDHRVFHGLKGLKSYYASVVFYVQYSNGNAPTIKSTRRYTIQY